MRILGITGGIGAGKSFLSKTLILLGVPVHSADKCIHFLLQNDSEIREKVQKRWPKAIVRGSVNRKILGDLVLSSPSELRFLEDILYPKLLASQKDFLKKSQVQGVKMVALDVPLLLEVGLDFYCDEVILALTQTFLRKKRVLKRRGMNLKKFEAFESEQMKDAQRIKRANFRVFCGRDKGSAFKRIKKILCLISQKPFPRWKGRWPSKIEKKRPHVFRAF